ncbi:MAG: DNA-binding protein WhiA [Bacilli bacterium]|nr:DNA-binding protein WhiA [Bacilli bacterium]
MTFTTRLKEEITKNDISPLESLTELAAFVRYSSQIKKNRISLTFENASVARRIYKDIKSNYGVNIKITIRNQKRFRVKQIYILEVTEKVDDILESLNIYKEGKKTLPEEYFLSSREEIVSYLTGAFLACGSVNDPSASGYHLEFTSSLKKDALYLAELLKEFNIQAKVLKRNSNYMTYIKSAEMISDMIRLLGATNCFFYFEDIRIYRDHKNMVNRLNNCEIANQEKVLKTGLKQLEDINYLKEHDLLGLLDENVREAIKYREAYPETSLSELADIISQETGREIGKSGVNHYFIKVKKLVERHKNKQE